MKPPLIRLLVVVATVGIAALGCSEFEPTSSMEFGADRDSGSEQPPPGDAQVPPPSFEEEAFDLTQPTASANFVFVANRTRGTLAKIAIDVRAIRISTVRVGAEPGLIVTHAESDMAAVLNEGSSSVTVVHARAIGQDDVAFTVDVTEHANRLALTPDGAAGFAWYDNRLAQPGDRPGSLTEVTAFMTAEDDGRTFQLSVGVNVRDVQFSLDGSRAYVLSDDGVSELGLDSLDADRFVPPVRIAERGENIPLGEDREILIAEANDLAVVRIGDRESLRMVDLVSEEVRDLGLPAVPTDVDLVAGTSLALVSLRDSEQLGILDLDEFDAGEVSPIDWLTLEGQPVGQTVLAPEGDRLLVFSAVADSERLSVVDLTTLTADTYNLRKGVRGAIVSPDGRTAVVYHSKAPGEPVAGEPEENIIAKSYGFTAIDLDRGLTKLVLTGANPGEMTFDSSGEQAFVLTVDIPTATHAMEWIDLRSFRTERFEFDRAPEHVGVVPGTGMVFVSQVHDLGRIAFIDLETAEMREVTGFELNGLID